MLSQKTQNYLCELLFEIAKGEKQVEVVRQLLAEQGTFEPYQSFRRIDQERKKYINSYDIKDFLSQNGFPHSLSDCDLFVKTYDLDQDTKISYTEYLRAVLPYDNQTLREQISQKPPSLIEINERLSCDVEYTLSKLIDREIKCNLAVLEKKILLETRYDFSVADCFNALDTNDKKVLEGRDFYAFFRKNGLVSYEDEILSLTRRLDFDNDGIISYEDFFRGVSKQESLEKAERRNPHEHQVIASPYRQSGISKSPLKGQKSYLLNQQTTPRSNLKDKVLSQQSSQKKNVQIMSPARAKNYSGITTEFHTSPLRDNSRFRSSTGFKHSPGKSILKNSNQKMEIEKHLLRNELQYQKEIDELHQSQYNSDSKEDYGLRHRIRDSSKEIRSNPNWQGREPFEYERQLEGVEEKGRVYRDEKFKTIDYEERDRLNREKAEYDYKIQNMKKIEKEQQMKYVERDNQYKQEKISRENQLRQLRIENELKLKEKEKYQKQIENDKKVIKESTEQFERVNFEKQIKQMQLEKEQRLQELENERRQQQIERLKQSQEKESRERKLKEEEINIREQIEYERLLKQKLEDEKRFISLEQNRRDNRPTSQLGSNDKNKNYLGSNDKNKSYLASHDQSYTAIKDKNVQLPNYSQVQTNYSQKKTATFAERSPLNQYSTPKRYEEIEESNRLSQSQSNNFRNSQGYDRKVIETDHNNKAIERSPYSKQLYDKTNKFERPSYTSPIDLRETSKNRTPIRNNFTDKKERTNDQDDYYKMTTYSTSQKPSLTNSNNRSRTQNSKIDDQLITSFLDIIQTEKKSERARQDLSLRPDFKLGDIYKVLDKSQKGFISSINLEELLRKLNINHNMNDIYLLMRRYDLDNDGQLRFTDITEVITPKQKEYAKLLNKRESLLEGDFSIDEVYSFETLKLLKELFETLIESEQIIESIRSQLKQNKNFSFQETFGLIDTNQDGFINQIELQQFFEKNNVFCSDKELKLLIQRFDQDRDNKISFGEFVQQLSPKSNKNY